MLETGRGHGESANTKKSVRSESESVLVDCVVVLILIDVVINCSEPGLEGRDELGITKDFNGVTTLSLADGREAVTICEVGRGVSESGGFSSVWNNSS